MPTQALLSVSEFHARYDGEKPAYEYWRGEAIPKSVPTYLHGIVQYLLMKALEAAGWIPASEVRLKVVPDSEPVPDIIATRSAPAGSYPEIAPELCIEITSPGDRVSKLLEKARQYVAWGSKSVWIIDPEERMAWMVTEENVTWIAPDGKLRVEETVIELREIFRQVDEKLSGR